MFGTLEAGLHPVSHAQNFFPFGFLINEWL